MIQRILFLATYLMLCLFVSAEISEPVINNLHATVEPNNDRVVIRYDLVNPLNTDVSVRLQFIDKEGKPSLYCIQTNGDVGYPVKGGVNKLIICHFGKVVIDITDYKVELIIEYRQQPDINQLIHEVSFNRIKNDISFLSVKRYFKEDSFQRKNIVQKISADFADNKLEFQKQEFSYSGHLATNLVGILPGVDTGNKIFIIGAHWDAVKESPGADDNASGVAGMLEVMRVLSKYKFHHSIYFVAFDMEEEGLFGSKEFVKKLRENNLPMDGLYINLDMIGYYSVQPNSQSFPSALKNIFPAAYKEVSGDNFKGDFILNTMNENSESLGKYFDSCAHVYVPDLQVISLVVPDDGKIAPNSFRASDHSTFWDAKMKAISIGDTGDNRNFNYHSPDDVIEKVDISFVEQVVKALTTTLATLAEITKRITATVPVCASFCKPHSRIFATSH